VTPSSGGGYGYYGNSEPSAIVQNNAEALMYFDIAANLGHPLAKDYIASHESVISQYGDITGIAANAAARARNWMPQLEYYPGATAGGVPHTDESLPSLAGRQALARVREIPFPAIEEALAFRGLLRGARGVWRASPAALVQAIKKFQSALNFEPTGFLFPTEVVRLIQMSAVDGDANSQNRLGIMYAKGIGVPQNFPRAEKWFFLAAKQHHGEALYNLGVLYKVGPNGVPQDKDKAARLFTEAAFAGFNPARCELRELLAQADDAERNHAGGPRR
jgi:TPR repeat protein